jgi:hypothetical protein
MPTPSFKVALGLLAVSLLPPLAVADVVTGTVTPAAAKAVVVDASGKTVAELKPGAYQLQLAPGRYKARCLAPTQREQEFLSLSEPVTVNVDCS